jgi:Fe-S-cluster containining protein
LGVFVTPSTARNIETLYNIAPGVVSGGVAHFGPKSFVAFGQAADGSCMLLDTNHRCGIYQNRPPECATYPFQLAIFDLRPDGGLKLVTYAEMLRKSEAGPDYYKKGAFGFNCLIPMIFAHTDCPGFTGKAITPEEYTALAEELWSPFSRLREQFVGTGQKLIFDDRTSERAKEVEQQEEANYKAALAEMKRGKLFEAQAMLETVLDTNQDCLAARKQLDFIYARIGDAKG